MKRPLTTLLAASMMFANTSFTQQIPVQQTPATILASPVSTIEDTTLAAVPASHLQGKDSEKNLEDKSVLSDLAYAKAGALFYRSLPELHFENSGPVTQNKPFALDVDWATQKKENRDMPFTDFVSLDYTRAKGMLTAFNMKYVKDSSAMFDDYFAFIKNDKSFLNSAKKKILEHESETRERSLVFYASFSEKDAQLKWYPGDRYFYGGLNTKKNGFIKETPETIRKGEKTHKKISNADGLLSVFNGTYVRGDSNGTFRWEGKDYLDWEKYYSVLATIALYNDGTFQLKKMKDLPDKKNIRHYVQNMLMMVQDGIPQEGAKTRYFSNYLDDFSRSYLFKDKSGNFGFIWTMYLPPYMLAQVAQKMNINDLVLLDNHSPIGCSITKPGAVLSGADKENYLKNSFRFVPSFADVSSIYKPIVGLSELMNRNIQTDFVHEAFNKNGSWPDFFAIYERDSPEVHTKVSDEKKIARRHKKK